MTIWVFVIHLTAMTVFGSPDVRLESHTKDGCVALAKLVVGKLKESGLSFTTTPPYQDYGITAVVECKEERR